MIKNVILSKEKGFSFTDIRKELKSIKVSDEIVMQCLVDLVESGFVYNRGSSYLVKHFENIRVMA